MVVAGPSLVCSQVIRDLAGSRIGSCYSGGHESMESRTSILTIRNAWKAELVFNSFFFSIFQLCCLTPQGSLDVTIRFCRVLISESLCHIYTPALKKWGVYWFTSVRGSVRPSVRPSVIPYHFFVKDISTTV